MTRILVLRTALVVGMGLFGACGGDGGDNGGGGGDGGDNGGGGGSSAVPADAPRPAARPEAPADVVGADGADPDEFIDAILDAWDACTDFCLAYDMDCLDDDDDDDDDDTDVFDTDDDYSYDFDSEFLDDCWDECDDLVDYAFDNWITDNTVTPGSIACADAFTDFIDCLFDYGECDPATEYIEAELFGGYAPSVCTSEWTAYESACEDL